MKYAIAVFCFLIVSGCAGTHCIELNGTYGEFSGGTKYCWNAEKSEEAGTPAFDVRDDESESSNTFFGFDEGVLDTLKEIIKDKLGISATTAGEKQHPAREIMQMVREYNAK